MGENASERVERARKALRACLEAQRPWEQCEASARELAQALWADEADVKRVVRELRSMGLSRRGAKALARRAKKLSPPPVAPDAAVEPGDTPVCPQCLAQLKPFDHICP